MTVLRFYLKSKSHRRSVRETICFNSMKKEEEMFAEPICIRSMLLLNALKISDEARTMNKDGMNTTVANLANNCVHTDGDTAAAIPRYERPLLCVRLPRVAVAAAVGHRGEEPAVDWTLPCRFAAAPLVEWTLGYSPRSTPSRGARSCKAHPPWLAPCPSCRLYPPSNPPTPGEEAGPSRRIPSRIADPSATGVSSRANFR